MIVKRKDGYHILSHDGKKHLGGPYSKGKAKSRLREIEYFKHIKEDKNMSNIIKTLTDLGKCSELVEGTITIEKSQGEYRVPAEDGYEDGAHYTDSKEDAIGVAKKVFGDDIVIKYRSVPEFVGGKYEKYRPTDKRDKFWKERDKFSILQNVRNKHESLEESQEGNKYIVFYKGNKITVTAETSYKAQLKALEEYKETFPRLKIKGSDLTVKLAEKDGKQVTTHCESNDVNEGEKEKHQEFEDMVGGVKKAEQMNRLWNNSYKSGTEYDKLQGRGKSKEEVFIKKAKAEGFTDKQINKFLSL